MDWSNSETTSVTAATVARNRVREGALGGAMSWFFAAMTGWPPARASVSG
jgi:hypothetical protein